MLAPMPAAFAAGPATRFSAGITQNVGPAGIAAGPDGNLWFTEVGDRIGRITPAGHVDEFSAGITPGAFPQQITTGPDGNLWFTETFKDQIGRITPTGHVDEFGTNITAGSHPLGIAAGADGNLWFAEPDTHRIGRITTAGHVDEFTSGITPLAHIEGITAGPDGNLWFTEHGDNGQKIGRITTGGAVQEFSMGITSNSQPTRITAGPDGNLWFTEYAGVIGRITPAGVINEYGTAFGLTAGSLPLGIAPGPDGNVWFVEESGGHIGRITPAGHIDEFPSGPPGETDPKEIAAGPDGNLWFTDGGNVIGRIDTDVPPPSSGNLLRNPGFEAGAPGTSRTVTVPVPGWVTVPNFTSGLYGGTNLPGTALADQIGGGHGFGWGGIGSPDQSHALQLVDVGREGVAIDDARASITLSGLLGGENGQQDTAKVTALFLTAAGDQLGSVQIGPVTSADRGSQTTLLPRTISAPVIKGTRAIRVVATATNIGGGSDNGYFDNLSLTLDVTPAPTTAGGTTPGGGATPGGSSGAIADTIAPVLALRG
jgi:streptogramin lyase